jgi:exonuclease III
MTIRIATWNLDHASNGSRPVEEQLKVIYRYNPDLVVLTETCDRVDLADKGYVCRVSSPNKYRKNYSAIWSKWPIVEEVATCDPVLTTSVRVQCPLGDLIIVGTILTWHGYKGQDGKSKKWDEHDKEILKQGEDWERIQRAHKGIPMIVAGDFNQARDGEGTYHSKDGIRLLNEQLERCGLISLTDENFFLNRKLKIDPRTGRHRSNIDHVCVSKDRFQTLAVGAWDHFSDDVELSDHNGVFADLLPV